MLGTGSVAACAFLTWICDRGGHALLKQILEAERATGALAIVNRHTYRFRIDPGAVRNVFQLNIITEYILSSILQYPGQNIRVWQIGT